MKELPLTRGRVAIVDDEDYDELSRYKWHLSGRYVARAKPKGIKDGAHLILLHCAIMGKIAGLEIDHINGDGLDNRRENLRHVTHAQNMRNQKSRQGSSKYKGVSWTKSRQKWCAQIYRQGKLYWLGYYQSEKDCALAYNNAAVELFGEYAWLNTLKE
jgi:hypothetical protein